MNYVDQVLRDQFENTFGITVSSFEYEVIQSGTDPVSIDYAIDLSFDDTSAFIPTQQEIDILVEITFLPPSVEDLISEFRNVGHSVDGLDDIENIQYTLLNVRNSQVKIGVFGKETTAGQGAALVSVSLIAIFATLVLFMNRFRNPRISDKLRGDETKLIMPAYSYQDQAETCCGNRLGQGSMWSMSSSWDGTSSSAESDSLVSWGLYSQHSGTSSNNRKSTRTSQYRPNFRGREV